MGARFRPGWGPSLLGIPACELVNQTLQLRTILDAKVEERFHHAVHARTLPERLSSLQTALLHRLADSEPLDFTIDAAVRWLAHNPHGRIDSLSRYIGYSPRQLQRRFTATVGYGPKLLHSVLRFQRLLALASRATMPHLLCEIAADAGYADQAHMSREVRRFTGRRPSEVLSSAHTTLDLSDLFKTPQDTGIQT